VESAGKKNKTGAGMARMDDRALNADAVLRQEQIEEKARHLLAQMTPEEKVGQMSGDTPAMLGVLWLLTGYGRRPIPAGANRRLSVPGIRFSDGPRGVVVYHSTCFPVSMARGASWDTGLEERIGEAMGIEAKSQGANLLGNVCINVLRHPAWGRAQETYGEDPYHLGEMGAASVRGVQRHVMACVKHFAANSIENARFKVDVRMDERTLREVYLPHFKRCVDEGVAVVMSAYNKVNGHYCGHHRHLLRDILRGEWAFQGLVVSDFMWGIHSAEAADAGLDLEMPFTVHFGRKLLRLVRQGRVPESVIDEAVLRILRQKIRFGQGGEPERYGPRSVVSEAHRALAREAAQKSMVLLKNERAKDSDQPVLPIDLTRVKRLAVIGRLAARANTGDRGSSMVRPPYVVTPLQGLRRAVAEICTVTYSDGKNMDRAVELARRADTVVVVAGYTHRDEGEYLFHRSGDRDSLTLKPRDEMLIQRVAAANPRTVVVMMGGSAIITESWREKIPAILMAWYPGMEGGHALADILLGRVNPSAKLPCSFPRSDEQLPFFDKHARSIEYARFHGYRLMDQEGHEPAFPFGFGLSYTTFAYSDLRLDAADVAADGTTQVSVAVTNTGGVAGDEVIQLYVGYEGSQVDRPVKELKGFSRVYLEPGQTRRVVLPLAARQVAYYDEQRSRWVIEPITCRVYVGPSSRADQLLSAQFAVRS
jgi:beta-glucosidase